MQFNKELFEKKIKITEDTIKKILAYSKLSFNFSGNIAVIGFNTQKVARFIQSKFPNAKVFFIEELAIRDIFCIKGLYYRNEGELINMLVDLENSGLCIIANLPYNCKSDKLIGSNIVNKIKNTINFKEFINLEPVVDYDKIEGLWNSVDIDNSIKVKGGFTDAAVIPSIATIHKNKVNEYSKEEFIIKSFQSKLYEKYFLANNAVKQKHFSTKKVYETSDIKTTIGFALRLVPGNHEGSYNIGGKKTSTYKLNNDLVSDFSEIKFNCGTKFILTNPLEKQNCAEFLYSKEGYQFCNALVNAMSYDNFNEKEHLLWFPNVDWNEKWTIQKLLTHFGYSEAEIAAVIKDLVNYKSIEE